MAEARLLVTGATGFVGSNLCALLAREGRPFRPVSREARPGYFAIGEAGAQTDWSDALDGCDAVIHLAARPAGDALAQAQAVALAENLARQAARHGVRRLLYVSSAKVHGDVSPPGRPFSEIDRPSPIGAYAAAKLESEERLGAIEGLSLTVVRMPLVHGPGVKRNFHTLMRAVDLGLPLPFAAVDNRRSLIAVENLGDFLVRAVDHPAAAGETLIVADDTDLSTPDLLGRIAAALGRPSRLWDVPPPLLEGALRLAGRGAIVDRLLKSMQVDASKARRLLQWSPPLDVDAGLVATCRAYRDQSVPAR